MSISKKITWMVILPIIALVILGAITIRGQFRLNTELQGLNKNIVPSLAKLSVIQRDATVMHAVVYRHVLATDEKDMDKQADRISQFKKDVLSNLADYEKNLITNDADREAMAATKAAFAGYGEFADKVMAASRSGDKATAQALMGKEATAKRGALTDSLGKVIKINEDAANAAALRSEAEFNNTKLISIGFAVVMIVVVSVVGFMIGRSITTPIGAMRDSMVSTTQNLDFTHRLNLTSNDEIGQAVQAYEGLLGKLQQSFREIQERIDSVYQAAAGMARSAGEISSSSMTQSDSASGMAASIEEMTVSVNHIASRASEVGAHASTSGKEAEKGADVILATVDRMTHIAETVRTSADAINNLKTLGETISSTVTVIKEVADQTNLLALNAAIEAARAGEQGRGFAVVADEVRKLAERTAKSTEEIATLLGRVQDGAINASRSMDDAVAAVSAGVESARSAGDAIGKIQTGANDMVGMVSEITDAVKEQSVASTHIAQEVERIAQMAEENSAESANTADGARQLDEMAMAIKAAVSVYRV
ncbi:MAG TPA: HAMP domain-containing methyl-accepting chemotaxis protein [Rhodocyclaceae bacterium]|nr:HAMP domain-containing methyl-accepting chemotaxis protein [Rhodocyclaceae bacterium]